MLNRVAIHKLNSELVALCVLLVVLHVLITYLLCVEWSSTFLVFILSRDTMKVVFCRYLAPEYFMFGKVSEKTDVFSFGVVLLELVTGRKPINNGCAKGEENLVVWVLNIWPDPYWFFFFRLILLYVLFWSHK